MTTTRVPRMIALALALLVSAAVFLTLTGCKTPAEKTESLPAPAATVQSLLELRAANSEDATAYARHVESTPLAQALAEDAQARKGDGAPIPEWETPTVSDETTFTAEVTVDWKPSEELTAWPEATVFKLKRVEDRWLVIDAVDEEAERE